MSQPSSALSTLFPKRNSLNEFPGDELIALELRESLDALGSIAGRSRPTTCSAEFFSTFCIGK